jgi:hypothetical protein
MTNRKQLRDEEQNWENEIFETEGGWQDASKGQAKRSKGCALEGAVDTEMVPV